MAHRVELQARPWLTKTGAEYDIDVRSSCLHYDLYAYKERNGTFWFVIEVREGGLKLLARTAYRLSTLDGMLYPMNDFTVLMSRVVWRRSNKSVFQAVHKRLLAQCKLIPGYARVSVLCHYVFVPDRDPWPLNMVNGYKYTPRGEGAPNSHKPTGRPRGRPRVRHPGLLPGGKLPNIL